MANPHKAFLLPLIIISNLLPRYGVLMFHWTLFSIVYVYWLELLIISSFQLLKIFFSQGDKKNGFWPKTATAIRFFVLRSLLFLFYLIFIIVFLGFLMTGSDKSDRMQMVQTMSLHQPFFKITLLNFLLYNLVEFMVVFIATGEYKTSIPNDHFEILDSHMIVVHIVVVLGSFLYEFVLKHFHTQHRSAMIACVCLFVLVKICIDIGRNAIASSGPQEISGKYI
jgi:hypothetical protein